MLNWATTSTTNAMATILLEGLSFASPTPATVHGQQELGITFDIITKDSNSLLQKGHHLRHKCHGYHTPGRTQLCQTHSCCTGIAC